MKSFLLAITCLALSPLALCAQQPTLKIPENLKPAFAILQATYQKVDAKKFPKPPADSVWLFRAASGSVGTAEVGFEGDKVVYMIFRRGVGGTTWTEDDVTDIHRRYSKPLLNEEHLGSAYKRLPTNDGSSHDLNRLRYGDGRIGNRGGTSNANNAAFIVRKDFDFGLITGGL